MPLRKLWNSLRRPHNPPAQNSTAGDSVEQGVVKLEDRISHKPGKGKPNNTVQSRSKSHLSNLLHELAPTTILEIGVGNGEQTVDYLTCLKSSDHMVRYFAIDQFELGGGTLSLRAFHQMLRSAGVRPQLFPETISEGLTRFLHTIGTADVILFSDEMPQHDELQIERLLARVSNSRTTILRQNQTRWEVLHLNRQAIHRAA